MAPASQPPMASPPPPPGPLDLELTVVSAKHLKNVNWRNGDLKPYAVAYLHPDRRAATKPDDSASTKPTWNERLLLPLPPHARLDDPSLLLTVDVFHSKPSETPKPLVGTVRSPLKDLLDPGLLKGLLTTEPTPIKTLELRRPSGRPQGKLRIRLALRERPAPPPEPSYSVAPPTPSGYYYSTAPPPPPPREYSRYSPPPPTFASYNPPPAPYSYGGYSDPYSAYYSSAPAYYAAPHAPSPAPAPVPARPYYDRAPGYGGPSAPVDYSLGSSSYYEQKAKGSGVGLGTGLAVGAVAGALGGLALEEGFKYEEEKIAERVESDLAARDDYSDYRADY